MGLVQTPVSCTELVGGRSPVLRNNRKRSRQRCPIFLVYSRNGMEDEMHQVITIFAERPPRNHQVMVLLILVIIPTLLMGCQSSDYGKGPIYLSPRIQDVFEKYKSLDDPGFFAISPDGRSVGWSYCARESIRCGGNGKYIAITSCEKRSRGVRCQIYAAGRSVVWDKTARADTPDAAAGRSGIEPAADGYIYPK